VLLALLVFALMLGVVIAMRDGKWFVRVEELKDSSLNDSAQSWIIDGGRDMGVKLILILISILIAGSVPQEQVRLGDDQKRK
jgi:hypothetical protein